MHLLLINNSTNFLITNAAILPIDEAIKMEMGPITEDYLYGKISIFLLSLQCPIHFSVHGQQASDPESIERCMHINRQWIWRHEFVDELSGWSLSDTYRCDVFGRSN